METRTSYNILTKAYVHNTDVAKAIGVTDQQLVVFANSCEITQKEQVCTMMHQLEIVPALFAHGSQDTFPEPFVCGNPVSVYVGCPRKYTAFFFMRS